MLRACRRVLKPGGRIAYYNIYVAEHLAPEQRRAIGKLAPGGLFTRAFQRSLLRSAGFAEITETDVTDEFVQLLRALLEANRRHASALRRALGSGVFEQQQAERQRTLTGAESGALKRALFVAVRPA